MQQHPKPNKRHTNKGKSNRTAPPRSNDSGGFLSLLLARISWSELETLNQRKHAAGRRPKVLSRGQLLAALLFHYTIRSAGNLGEHLLCLLGIKMAESSLSERRQALPFEVFRDLLRRVLRPVEQTAEGFFKGWRLVAIDGVSFSMANTVQINGKVRKGGNQRGRASFAKLQCAALIELALHNPLAASLGLQGQSEWRLAHELLEHLPPNCLLLADRLYGCGAFLLPLTKKLSQVGGRFLVRAKQSLKVVRRIKELGDGSWMVEVKALNPQNHHQVIGTIEVREIYATVQRAGHRPVIIRLWTDLTEEQASAEELVRLYMSRWEQELYFRELKNELGINDLLASQTVETAAQEVVAMIVGSSLIAHERAKLQPGEELQRRVSFIKTWQTLEPLWLTLLLGSEILTEVQKQQLCERFYSFAAMRVTAKRRSRSCPRAVRQPFLRWPRKRKQKSFEGPIAVAVLRSA